jgi:hypothetical protein
MNIRTIAGAFLGLAGLIGLCGPAMSSPVSYNWTSGSVTIFATTGGSNLLTSPSNIFPLTSASQVTFDAALPSVTSFLFADLGPSTAIFSPTAFTGAAAALNGGQLILSNVVVAPGTGYSSVGSGSNPYNVTMNNLASSGNYVLKNAGGTTLASGTFSNVISPTLSGQILLGGTNSQQLALNGITLAAVSFGGQSLLVKGDVLFNGLTPVPLPAAAWLLGSGLLGLSGMAKRRRRESPSSTVARA